MSAWSLVVLPLVSFYKEEPHKHDDIIRLWIKYNVL